MLSSDLYSDVVAQIHVHTHHTQYKFNTVRRDNEYVKELEKL